MNGLPNQRAQSTPGRSDTPVKPTSEVAHQPAPHPEHGCGDICLGGVICWFPQCQPIADADLGSQIR